MHLVRVRVRNFRGIAEGEVHLNGHTVLVGDNNAGKSTLLEAVALLALLEPQTSQEFHDEFGNLQFDASRIIYVATSNDTSLISDPVKSRFDTFEISYLLCIPIFVEGIESVFR